MILYHGTNQVFETFSLNPSVRSSHGASASAGIFMTTLPAIAEQYARMAQRKLYPGNHDEHVRKVADLVARSQAAERRRDFDASERLMEEAERLEAEGLDTTVGGRVLEIEIDPVNPMILENAGRMDLHEMKDVLERAFEAGHDAVIFEDIWDPASLEEVTEPYDHVIVRDPDMIRIIGVRELGEEQERVLEDDCPSP